MIRTGNDYAGKPGYLSFDGYTVIDHPCPKREDRVFHRTAVDGMGRERRSGTDYSSHSLQLAEREGGLFILVEHGGGREIFKVRDVYVQGGLKAAILAVTDPVQRYALLYSLWDGASREVREALQVERAHWAQAYVDKRIRTKRKAGKISVVIAPIFEAFVNQRLVGRFTGKDQFDAHEKASSAAQTAAREMIAAGADPRTLIASAKLVEQGGLC